MLMHIEKGRQAYQILKLVSISGDMPWSLLAFVEGHYRAVIRTLHIMEENEIVVMHGIGQNRTIRLTKKGLALVLNNIGEVYFNNYLEVSDNENFKNWKSKEGHRRILRRHRAAETLCMALLAGAKGLTGAKPALTKLNVDPPIVTIRENDQVYYSSKQVKNMIEGHRKVDFTRMHGLLISPGGVYNIYNCGRHLIYWKRPGESKIKVLVNQLLVRNYERPPLDEFTGLYFGRAIMMGSSMDIALRILNSDSAKKGRDYEALSVKDVYKHSHFIPLSLDGVRQLKLLMRENYQSKLTKAIFGETENLRSELTSVDCDAVIKCANANKYILLFFDGNLTRLQRMKNACTNGLVKGKFEVICFPWQFEMVKNYMPKEVDIQQIPYERIDDLFDLVH